MLERLQNPKFDVSRQLWMFVQFQEIQERENPQIAHNLRGRMKYVFT